MRSEEDDSRDGGIFLSLFFFLSRSIREVISISRESRTRKIGLCFRFILGDKAIDICDFRIFSYIFIGKEACYHIFFSIEVIRPNRASDSFSETIS